MILYFSGCGNSQFVATELARLTNEPLVKINPLEKTPSITIGDDETLGIVCPVYAWSVPRLVTDYIDRMTPSAISHHPSYVYLACTCGDNVGRTPERFDKELRKKGWCLDAAFSFIMPETYINLPGFKLDSPENEKRKIDAVRNRLTHVAELIKQRELLYDVERGKMPRFNSYVFNWLFYRLIITDRKFRANDDCISCGLCKKICPLNNITLENGKPHWHGNCTNCMACYHHCPKNAIHFGKATVGKGQYFFKIEN